MQRHVHNHSPCLFCQYLQTEVKEVTNAHTRWYLTFDWSADGFLPLRAFKPSSSESADRGRSTWADPGFQVRGDALKKLRRTEGGAKIFGYFVWKITILRQKIIFFPILGGGGRRVRPLPPGSAPAVLFKLLANLNNTAPSIGTFAATSGRVIQRLDYSG